MEKGFYDENPQLNAEQREQLFHRWASMQKSDKNHQKPLLIGPDSDPLLPVYTRRVDEVPRSEIKLQPLTKFEL
jgi:hypothetical protein